MYNDKNLLKSNIKNIIGSLYLSVPILASIVSMIHSVALFDLGNNFYIACIITVIFEIGMLAPLAATVVYPEIKKNFIWLIFTIITILQLTGNVYYTYEVAHTKNISIFTNFINEFINETSSDQYKLFLALLLGIPLPLISSVFIKATDNYLKLAINKSTKKSDLDKNIYNDNSDSEKIAVLINNNG